jgi:hypothetical protein
MKLWCLWLFVLGLAAGACASRAFVSPQDIVEVARTCAHKAGFTCQGSFALEDLKKTLPQIEGRVFVGCARYNTGQHGLVVLHTGADAPTGNIMSATWHAYQTATSEDAEALTACTAISLEALYNTRAARLRVHSE